MVRCISSHTVSVASLDLHLCIWSCEEMHHCMSSLGVIIAQLTFQKHFRKVPKISLSKEFNRVSGLNRPSQNVNKQNCQLKSRTRTTRRSWTRCWRCRDGCCFGEGGGGGGLLPCRLLICINAIIWWYDLTFCLFISCIWFICIDAVQTALMHILKATLTLCAKMQVRKRANEEMGNGQNGQH